MHTQVDVKAELGQSELMKATHGSGHVTGEQRLPKYHFGIEKGKKGDTVNSQVMGNRAKLVPSLQWL